MKRIKINRWIYSVVVVLVAIGDGLVLDMKLSLASIGLGLALQALTFPMGLIGALCALPLIYTGIATMTEALFLAAPVYAIAGVLQWYVVFPRLFSQRSGPLPDADTTGSSAKS